MLAAWNFRGKGNVWLPAKRMGKTDGHCVNARHVSHQLFAAGGQMAQSRIFTAQTHVQEISLGEREDDWDCVVTFGTGDMEDKMLSAAPLVFAKEFALHGDSSHDFNRPSGTWFS